MKPPVRFSAPWSLAVRVITIVCLALLLGASFWGSAFMGDDVPLTMRTLVTFVPLAILLAALPFMVRGFVITDDELYVERLGWRNHFALTDVVSAEASPEALRGSIRLCGSGGLFGFFGWFRNGSLGVYRAYGTDPKRAVIIKLKQRNIVVTPDDPERFVATLNQSRECGRESRPAD